MYWSQVLSGWLMPKEGRRDPVFLGYLRNGLTQNKPWDQFARDMMPARGNGGRGVVVPRATACRR